MSLRSFSWMPCIVIVHALAVLPVHADTLAGGSGFTPRVPISALAMPAAWFDPSRLHLSSSVSVGSGFGSGVNALQVTRLSYQFKAPLWMDVSLGNAWGSRNSAGGRNSFFLEGVNLAYRPFPSLLFQVQYRDFRSPLQYSNGLGYGFWSP